MATIKSYTDIEQSKKLAEILPLESADMTYYACVKDWRGNPVEPKWRKPTTLRKEELALPCSNFQEYEYVAAWSLAALLGVLPYCPDLSKHTDGKWYITTYPNDVHTCSMAYDNPIDACYEMMLKLHELNLL